MRGAHAGLHLARHKVCVCVCVVKQDVWTEGGGAYIRSMLRRGAHSADSSRRVPLNGGERHRQTAAIHTHILRVPRGLRPPATTRIVRLMEVSAGAPEGPLTTKQAPGDGERRFRASLRLFSRRPRNRLSATAAAAPSTSRAPI